jgi:hypothetical protein
MDSAMNAALRSPPALIGALFAGLLLAGPAQAFRCGSHIVHEGDPRARVAKICGEPSEVSHRSIWRRPAVWRYGRPYYVPGGEIEVPVETWIYNLGPNKLMRRIRFEDGIVVEIETLGYGYWTQPTAPP